MPYRRSPEFVLTRKDGEEEGNKRTFNRARTGRRVLKVGFTSECLNCDDSPSQLSINHPDTNNTGSDGYTESLKLSDANHIKRTLNTHIKTWQSHAIKILTIFLTLKPPGELSPSVNT